MPSKNLQIVGSIIPQANLMQNDPTAPDYIKGRTHWTDDPVTTTETEVIVEEQTLQFTNTTYFENGVWDLVLGETYTVTWDGTVYECVCKTGTFSGNEVIGLGNTSIYGDGDDTGEPFAVGVMASSNQRGFITTDNESHTVSIVKITSTTTQTVHMLDPKYYERIAWVEPGFLSVVGEWTTMDADTDGDGTVDGTQTMFMVSSALGLEIGKTYTVKWDGVDYESVCSDVAGNTSVAFLGNPVAFGNEDNGLPFMIVEYLSADDVAEMGFHAGVADLTQSEEHDFSIIGPDVVHTIDTMFLPNGVPYVVEGYGEILPEIEVQQEEGGSDIEAPIDRPLNLEVGKTYIVVYGGVEYECVAQDVSAQMGVSGACFLGDGTEMGLSGNGEPFAIVSTPVEMEAGVYGAVLCQEVTTVSIYGNITKIQKLDERCLPTGVPYIIEGESTSTLIFDGDFTGKESLDGMMVKVSDNVVSVSDLEKVTAIEIVGIADGAPNGTFTELIAVDMTADGVPALILGSYFEESELPLMYIFLEDYSMEGMSATKGIYILGMEGSCYVSKVTATSDIFGEPDVLNKLDPVLLPDNVPYLIEGEDGEVILEETTGMPDYDGFISAPTFNVIPDKTVIVTWNGTDYECLVHSLEYNGTNFYAFGNSERIYALYGATVESNNAPFTAFAMPDGSTSYVMAEDNSTEVTVSMRYTETPAIIQKLDNRCLDLEWYADGPHENLTEIFPETSVANRDVIFDSPIPQIPYEAYSNYPVKFVYDGVRYDTTLTYTVEGTPNDGDMILCGNLSILDTNSLDTGEPFLVYGYYEKTYATVNVIFADQGTHTISISLIDGYTYNTIPKEYLPDLTSEIQETLEPIKNQLKETMLVLTDTVNGYEYIIQMQNGNLISICKCGGITITSLPTKTEYNEGDTYDLSGLAVSGVRQDGEVYEIEGWVVEDHDEVATLNNGTFYVSYTEHGETFTTSFDLTVIDWGAVNLTDFTYTKNSDGTYTITDWKGTLNGEASTEMIVPDSDRIII